MGSEQGSERSSSAFRPADSAATSRALDTISTPGSGPPLDQVELFDTAGIHCFKVHYVKWWAVLLQQMCLEKGISSGAAMTVHDVTVHDNSGATVTLEFHDGIP